MKTKTQIAAEITSIVHDHLLAAGATAAEISDPVCIIRTDGSFIINAEHPFCGMFADAYGEFQDGEQYILPAIEDYAEANGIELEWETPGSIAIMGPYA